MTRSAGKSPQPAIRRYSCASRAIASSCPSNSRIVSDHHITGIAKKAKARLSHSPIRVVRLIEVSSFDAAEAATIGMTARAKPEPSMKKMKK